MLLRIIFLIIVISEYSHGFSHNLNITPHIIRNSELAFKYAREKKWSKALTIANRSGDNILRKMIMIEYYADSDTDISINELKKFVEINYNWPQVNLIRKKLEHKLINNNNEKEILTWFKSHPPLTSQGSRYIAELSFSKHIEFIKKYGKENLDNKEKIRSSIKNIWIKNNFSLKEETNFLLKYNHLFTINDHIKRINRLLWSDNYEAAERILHKIDPDHRKLLKARIFLAKNPDNDPEKTLSDIPNSLRNDPGIIYETLKYYIKKGDYELCFELAKKLNKFDDDQKKWWKMISRIIRESLDLNQYNLAYNLAKDSSKFDMEDRSEVEWLAGWIAYNFLDKKEVSYRHFENLYKVSSYPTNKARGAYWTARAAKNLGQKDLANKWYNIAARYNFTFYGQFAVAKLTKNGKVNFVKDSQYSKEDLANSKKNDFLRAAQILSIISRCNDPVSLKYFELAIEKAKSNGEYALIVGSGRNMNILWSSVASSKILARKRNLVFTKYSYPELDLVKKSTINHNFAHSIIRRETMFDHKAISPKNATGLMQIMPAVGKKLSEKLNLKFSEKKLLTDMQYNIKLGTYLLDKLLDKYQDSYILSSAAYNAGSAAVARWIKNNGDPRLLTKTIDIINWIEKIPYKETREYVMRILENIQIYKNLATEEKKIEIKLDIKRGNLVSLDQRNY